MKSGLGALRPLSSGALVARSPDALLLRRHSAPAASCTQCCLYGYYRKRLRILANVFLCKERKKRKKTELLSQLKDGVDLSPPSLLPFPTCSCLAGVPPWGFASCSEVSRLIYRRTGCEVSGTISVISLQWGRRSILPGILMVVRDADWGSTCPWGHRQRWTLPHAIMVGSHALCLVFVDPFSVEQSGFL